MTTTHKVSGTRHSSGNDFEAPVEVDEDEDPAEKFKEQVDDPDDFTVDNVKKV